MAEKRLLTVKETSEYLGIPEWTLRGKIRLREVPFVKLGTGKKGRVYFDRRDLDDWIEKHKIHPFDELWDETG